MKSFSALGRYIRGDSILHRLDPRTKLLCCAFAVPAVFLEPTISGVAITWPLLLLALVASRIPPMAFVRALIPFVWLFAFTMVLHFFTAPGSPAGAMHFGLSLTAASRGLLVSIQLATAITYCSLLSFTTKHTDVGWAMERLLSPLGRWGVPVSEFATATNVAMSFFPLMRRQAEKLRMGMSARQVVWNEMRLLQRLKTLQLLFAALFRKALVRAGKVAIAMDARCAGLGARKAWKQEGSGPSAADFTALALSLLTFVVAAAH